jgi:hypothetical protein
MKWWITVTSNKTGNGTIEVTSEPKMATWGVPMRLWSSILISLTSLFAQQSPTPTDARVG